MCASHYSVTERKKRRAGSPAPNPDGETRQRRPAAERQRECRARKDHCVARNRFVDYDGEVLDMLIRRGWLAEQDAGDERAVGRAISRALADAARR
jgi:hypothetical protein